MQTLSRSTRTTSGLLVVVGIGLLLIALVTVVVIASLVFPGTPLDALWVGKPGSRTAFDKLGLAGIAFVALLGVAALAAGIGLLQRRRWARWVAVVLLGVNAIPDLVQGFTGQPAILIAAIPVALVTIWLTLPVVGRALRPRRARQLAHE